MPIPKDYVDIINMLKQATDDGRVIWRPTRFGVSVKVDKLMLELWSGTDEETDTGFVTCALHSDTSKSRSAADTWFVDANDDHYQYMLEFFNSAKRQGLGIPVMLDSLRVALAEGRVIGETISSDKDDLPF